MYLDDIQFAVRDAEFVPHADMDSIQFPKVFPPSQGPPVDPAFILHSAQWDCPTVQTGGCSQTSQR